MKTTRVNALLITAAFPLLLTLPVSTLAQSMGWIQTTTGTYQYFDTNNWLNGEINGVFGTNIASKFYPTITFTNDFDIVGNTFIFDYYSPGEPVFVFRGDGTDVTAALKSDFIAQPTYYKGSLTFGSTTAGQAFNFDLGGATRAINSKLPVYIYNTIANGTLLKTGTGDLYLQRNASAATANIRIDTGYVYFDSSVSGITGGVRAAAADLHTSYLNIKGNNGVDSVDTVAGDITTDGSPNGGAAFITVDAGTKSTLLHASELVRANSGLVVLRGDNFGDTPGAGIGNFFVDTPPALIGGNGSEGGTSLSIVPWAVGSKTTTGGGNASYDQTFVTYEAGNGFRPLDLTTEYTNEVASGSVTWQNVRVPNTTNWTLTADTTINALLLQGSYYNVSNTVVSGSGTLTVRSGMVIMGYHGQKSPVIEAPLDFGAQQGVIGYAQGKNSYIKGNISGSGGIVFYQPTTSPSSGNLSVQGSCDYTGDTYVLGFVAMPDNTLPHGSRLGDIYAFSKLMINNATMNGLNGTGNLNKPNSGGGTIQIGDNDSDGDFSGNITQFGNLAIVKIGAGTQRFGGTCSYQGTTTVSGGTLIIDGSITSTTTVQTNAILRGAGTIDKAGTTLTVDNGAMLAPGDATGIGTMTVLQGDVAFADGSRMEATVGQSGNSLLQVAGNVTGSGTIPVTVNGEGIGKWLIMQATSIAPDFVSATSGVVLTLENGDTEVWAERLNPVTVIIIR